MTIYETPQHKRLFLFCFLKDIKIIFTDSNRAAETVCGGGASWALVILWVDDEDANHTFLKRKFIFIKLFISCLFTTL